MNYINYISYEFKLAIMNSSSAQLCRSIRKDG